MNCQQFLTYSPEVKVAALYPANVQGVWYDPSNFSTLFQDSAFTVPVTAVEQPVGGMLDLSGRGNHATQATTTKRPVLSRRVNVFSTTQAVLNGTATAIPDAFGPGFDGLQTARTSSSDEVYLPINPSDVKGGCTYTLKVYLKKGGQASSNQICSFYTSAGYCSFTMVWDSGTISYGSASGGFTITNHSSVKLSADSYYVTMDFAVPDSVTSVTFARIYCWAGGQGVPSYIIGNPQFSLATDARLPYQWVSSVTNYDADPSKFPAYLRFDGVDDAMQTGNIDFTGTDKITVWAGLAKLSDAARATVTELGNGSVDTSSVLYINAPGITPSVDKFSFTAVAPAAGASVATATGSDLNAPINTVVCGFYTPGETSKLRINSVQRAAAGAVNPAGNFASRPLYIGARAGTSLYFNGRLYSLIVCGAQTPLQQVEATELYIKQKMRMP